MKSKAFTLIEMIVVVAIIGVISAFVIPLVSKIRSDANTIHIVTHRHADGTSTVYKPIYSPRFSDGGEFVLHLKGGKTVRISGDVTIETAEGKK